MILVGCEATQAAAQSRCLSADTLTVSRIVWLKAVVTRGDAPMVEMRDTLRLVSAPDSTVKLVTTSAVCAQLADSIDAYRGVSATGRVIYVYEVGSSRYAAEDPADSGLAYNNGQRAFFIFSSSCARLEVTLVQPWMMSQFEWDPDRS